MKYPNTYGTNADKFNIIQMLSLSDLEKYDLYAGYDEDGKMKFMKMSESGLVPLCLVLYREFFKNGVTNDGIGIFTVNGLNYHDILTEGEFKITPREVIK